MNVPLFLAGLLALTAAAVHGMGGELLVVRKLWQGPRRLRWHWAHPASGRGR